MNFSEMLCKDLILEVEKRRQKMNFSEMFCKDLILEVECPEEKGNIKIEVFDQRQREKDVYPFLFRVTYYGHGFSHIVGKTINWSMNDIVDYVTGLKTSHTYFITSEYIKKTVNELLHESDAVCV